jgi:hypothetical protein
MLVTADPAVASAERHGMMFRRHPGILESGGKPVRPLELGPAAVFFQAAGPLLTGIVQQPLADILPDRLGAGEPDGVDLLDLNGAAAAAAGDPQQVSLYLGQPLHPDRWGGRPPAGIGTRVVQDGLPVFRRHFIARTRRAYRRRVSAHKSRVRQLFHLFRRRHAPARGSIGHRMIRTYHEQKASLDWNAGCAEKNRSKPVRSTRNGSDLTIVGNCPDLCNKCKYGGKT